MPALSPSKESKSFPFVCPTGRAQVAALASLLTVAVLWGGQRLSGCSPGSTTSAADSFGDNPFSAGTSGKLFKAVKVRDWTGSRVSRRHLRRTPDLPAEDAPCVCGGGTAWRPGGQVPRCAKWAVTTTIFKPTDLVQQLSKLKGWCTVVAGDRKGPPEGSYNLPNVVFLDAQGQEMLTYKLAPTLMWNHFSRKNIGFVFALEHGAQWVFDCDDDNPLKADESGNAVQPPTGAWAAAELPAVDTSHQLWNPYPMYNHTNFMWPRGFPLNLIRTEVTQRGPGSASERWSSVAVLQSLADNDPDVDAIYRLTRPLPHYFARTPGAVALPPGVMAPYNAQACLFRRDALWSLLLPVTVHGRVSDIWRSYFTQRILWWAGKRIAFAAPFVTQFRNAHNYLADFQSENALYLQSGELVRRLNAWSPSARARDVGDAMEELIIDMYEHNIIEAGDVYATQAWIEDLDRIGYQFPKKQSS
eukprot:TRINITY_DN1961_c0_g1_i2.p1 TRINITY_DN1961_c0_g1~~TRINITY_DN1961_c0_g1_i2.p1  ORF type:complete len:472 (+),score=131.41 TRINITY_DN1961_c0_g1_i2:83-1498(+)